MNDTGGTVSFLRLRVLLLLGGAVVGAVLLGAYAAQTWFSLRKAEEDIGRNLQALALSLSEQAESTFRASRLVLFAIQKEIYAAGGREKLDGQALHRLFRRYLAQLPPERGGPNAYAISVTDARGQAYANTVEFPTMRVDASDRDYFLHHRGHANEDVYLSRLSRSRVTGLWVIFLSIRLNDMHGAFDGVLTISLWVNQFESFYRRLNLPEGSAVTLQREDGLPLYRFPFVDDFAKSDLGEDPTFRRMVRDRSGNLLIQRSPFDGRPRYIGFHAGEQFPLLATVSIDRSKALSHWRGDALLTGGFAAAAIAVIIGLLSFAMGQLRRLESVTAESLHDTLTGLPNRRFFEQQLAGEWRRLARDRQPISAAFIDIDYFKRFNDRYGHAAGDRCLKQVADVLARQMRRGTDMLARYGGEEFVCLLSNTDSSGAAVVAESLRAAVERAAIAHADSPVGPVITISVGHSTLMPGPNRDMQSLVASADAALYLAKETGRNRVCAAAQAPDARRSAVL